MLPQRILQGFVPDVGKSVKVRLTEGTLSCEIREITPAGIKVYVLVRRGQTTGKIGKTIALDDLSVQEKVIRLGTGESPDLLLLRGLLANEAGRSDLAKAQFEKVDGPLAAALITQLGGGR